MLFTVNWNTNNIYSLETDLFDISIIVFFFSFFPFFMIADPNLLLCTQTTSGDDNNHVHVDYGQGTIN